MLNPPVLTATIGTFTDLNNLVKNGGTITLTQDYAYNSATDSSLKAGVAISKASTIIYGNGHTIDGMNIARIFRITANDVKVYNLTFYRGYTSTVIGQYYRGGGVYIAGKNCYIVDSNFIECKGQGGAAVNFAISGTSATSFGYGYMYNCTFYNNSAYQVTSTSSAQTKPSVLSSSSYTVLTISNSIIIGNELINKGLGKDDGAIFNFAGAAANKNDKFTNNVIYNNTVYSSSVYIFGTISAGSSFDYNWYGSNNPDINTLVGGSSSAKMSWLVMNFTNTTPFSTSGGSVNLQVSLNALFNHTNRQYQQMIGGIAPRTVTYSANIGSFNATTDEFNGLSNVKYTYPAGATNITITAKLDNQILFLRFYDNLGTWTELQQLIDSTPAGGEIKLTKDYYYDSRYDLPLTHGMMINKGITIKGNNHMINGIGNARIFNITGNYVNISNVVFTGGYTVSPISSNYIGAAIYSTGTYLNVTSCSFENNTALSSSTSGGIIYTTGTGTTFSYNSYYNNYGKLYVSSKLMKHR